MKSIAMSLDRALGVVSDWRGPILRNIIGSLGSGSSRRVAPADMVIRVDYKSQVLYPQWVKQSLYPALEAAGPETYDLGQVCLFRSFNQEHIGCVVGDELHAFFHDSTLLQSCLSLRDGIAIAKKGADPFLACFPNEDGVFLWKSVVEDCDGGKYVPYLVERGGEVRIRWRSLAFPWFRFNPAAHIRGH